jgi:aryl-alcohol dehydrogenase-like predicted oxidoreductase
MPMEYGSLQGIDKPLSRLVQGTIPLSADDEAGSFALLDGVYESGGRAFDTAHSYGNGMNETVLGNWIRSRGVRDDVVVLGKCAHPENGKPKRVNPEDITSDLHESLQRQQTDYIDLWVLHRDDEDVPVGPIIENLTAHRRAGKISAFGASNWTTARIQEANQYAADHDLEPFSLSSSNFSLAVQIQSPWEGCVSISGPDAAAERAWYVESGLPNFPWSSLAGGFFSGRFTRDNLDTFDSYLDKLAVTTYCSEENFQRLDRAKELADRYGASVPRIAMAYVMNQPIDTYALVGSQKASEFAENVEGLATKLSQAELDWLDLTSDERPW